MTMSADIEAEIRRLHNAERWPVGTIARQMSIHGDVVRRVLQLTPPPTTLRRPSIVDDYTPFIAELLQRWPTLRASRVFDMVCERGFSGSVRTIRAHVAELRPTKAREAWLRTSTLIGEQSQIDWAFVGYVDVDGTKRAMWMFVIVLSWSRALWAEMCFSMDAATVARSLVRAGEAFGGVTRTWLFDNPKTIVIERNGPDIIRFHPLLLSTTTALNVQPKLCAPRKPQEKGKVERAIRFMRDRALSGWTPTTIEDGNERLRRFCDEVAMKRPHPTIEGRTVGDCFAEERLRLLPLPTSAPPTDDVRSVVVDKTAFIRFDCNDYSVPHTLVGKTLTVVASDSVVRVVDVNVEVARHSRSWARKKLVEDARHRAALVAHKHGAKETKRREQLQHRFPTFTNVIERWLDENRNVGSASTKTWTIVERYGDKVFSAALAVFIERGLVDPSALESLCEGIRRRQQPAPLTAPAPSHPSDRDVIPHALESYDEPT